MKVLNFLWIHILWVVYLILTAEQRSDYYCGCIKGMDCKTVGRDTSILGAWTDVEYYPGREPTRRYRTYREFTAIWEAK